MADEEEGLQVQPFLCRVDDDAVLTGQVNRRGHIEWEWSRVSAAVKLETQKDGLFLKRGLEEFQTEFLHAQLSMDELHYRGADAGRGEVGRHTVESRALVLMLCLFPLRRQTRKQAKELSLRLLKALMDRSMQAWTGCVDLAVPACGGLECVRIKFENGIASGLSSWVGDHRQAASKWKLLQGKPWCQQQITSTLEQATVFDLMLWLLFVKACASTSSAWHEVGQHMWPRLLYIVGCAVEEYALKLAEKAPEAAPLLKTKRGNAKRVPFVNRLVLLRKLKDAKSHRKSIMRTHSDLVPSTSDIVRHEDLLEVSEYLKLLKETFKRSAHLQVSWDPSNYSGDEVMVCTVWSNQCNKAAYLPLQYLQPVRSQEVEPDIQALAQRKEITRVHGFSELRAVSHALAAIDKDLSKFLLPQDVVWKPLKRQEQRDFIDGAFWVTDTVTGECRRQLPQGWTFRDQPLLCSVSDQGGINRGVLDYVQFMLPLGILVAYDSTHRCYNDLKASLRASRLFRSFLAFGVVHNINYGPAGTKTWFTRKRHALHEFCEKRSCHSNPFLSYMASICQERGEVEDGTAEQRERMWAAMKQMKGCQIHGPLTKLMRWYSWWESCKFHSGEVFFTKLLMLHGNTWEAADGEADFQPSAFDPDTAGMTPQQELRHLKIKLGTWALAPALVNQESMWQKTLIYEGGRPLWSKYSHLAADVNTAGQVQDHMVYMALGGWKQELADICSHCFFNVEVMKQLYGNPDDATEDHLQMHCKFAISLISERAMSLVAEFCKPPWRHAALCSAEHFLAGSERMQQEWECILVAENLAAEGHRIEPLGQIHCLQTAFVRLHYLANEMDRKSGLGHGAANGVLLAQTACRHVGDTVVVENSHQKVKDLLAAARHDQISRSGKFHSLVNSGVLEGRQLPSLRVTPEQIAAASAGRGLGQKITQATHPSSHKMKKEFQNVMKYKASSPDFTWPSSSHTSLLLC